MGSSTRIWFFGILCFVSTQGSIHNRSASRDEGTQTTQCDFSTLEARIQRLETHVSDHLNGLRRDIWASSRNIEQETTSVKNAIESYRNEIRALSDRLRKPNNQLQPKNGETPELNRELQVVITTLRLLTYDLEAVRQNISELTNATNAIRNHLEVDKSIKQIFNPVTTQSISESDSPPPNCLEIKKINNAVPSGIYLIQPKGSKKPFLVHCDMQYQNGGWLTIHNRFTGELDFYREWQDYKVGFGNTAGEHWLGLEHLYELTGNEVSELLIQLEDINNVQTFAHYGQFSIGSEEEGYPIKVLGGYRGTAGDSLSYHAGSKFSTKDKDQDSWPEGQCAQSHGGAWWYKSCDTSNLNGRYLPGPQPELVLYQLMYWGGFNGPQSGLKSARMMIRPHQSVAPSSAARQFLRN